MTLIQYCVALSTFALFSAAVWNLVYTRHPCLTPACIGRWAVWCALNFGLALASAAWWMEHHRTPAHDEVVLCLLRLCAAGLLVLPLRRREDREGRRA